jgi:EAL domain-containing protein (putative c-di-GMP-specific phosphodiesterase class I)
LSIGVNVSASQLAAEHLVGDVEDALDGSGLDPSRLILEVAEASLMSDAGETASCLDRLKRLGVRIAVDDFGTAYSSLSYLRHFPVDILKIDRSYVAEVGDSHQAATLLHMLVGLGKEVGLETVAEGIERGTQLAAAPAEHCDSVQGFLLAEPMPAGQVQGFVEQWSATRRAPYEAALGS